VPDGADAKPEIVLPERPLFDEARLAVAGFLARYSDSTRASYAYDLRAFFGWCERAGRAVPMIASGVSPDLADDASWWHADDLWIFSTYALLVYLRIASARTGHSTEVLCRRIAQRHAVELAPTPV
jgi:hypothetical protein